MSNVAPVHILIAEDSATQAQRLRHILEQQGYRVTVAGNGRLALEAARRDRPALIISDIVMPEMTGYELCRHLKQDVGLSETPVILVTTLSDPQDVIRGLECRADNFILKPYDAEQLLRRIQFVLVNSHMRPNDESGMGLEIVFSGQRHFITADRLQILNLLLSTYEAAMQRNEELSSTRDALRQSNTELQEMTRQLEDRVRLRTRELESSNEALRQAQQALVQQERLSALGQMASGIAHDINNAISPISLYTESLLMHEPGLSTEARSRLTTIQRAIDDVAQTVARMREFYRPQEARLQLVNVDVNTLVQQVIELTRARWNDQPQRKGVMIELKTELADALPEIAGADYEIRDAITNLIFNAVDAVPKGGTISVRTHAGSGETVCLEVADNGIGMDDATRQRCLEPFFTTKGKRGTGLGLAMVYGMAKRHAARMDVESQLGAGTTFRLTFPVSRNAGASAPGSQLADSDLPPLHILIVDDDPVRVAVGYAAGRRTRGRQRGRRTGRHRCLPRRTQQFHALRRRDHGSRHALRRWPPGGAGRPHVLAAHTHHHAERLGTAPVVGRAVQSAGRPHIRQAAAPARVAGRPGRTLRHRCGGAKAGKPLNCWRDHFVNAGFQGGGAPPTATFSVRLRGRRCQPRIHPAAERR
jgi:signal transduction histidine kinase